MRARRVGRALATAAFAVLYAASYGAGLTLRAVVIAASWSRAALSLGWSDGRGAFPEQAPPDLSNMTPAEELLGRPIPPRRVRDVTPVRDVDDLADAQGVGR